MVYINSLFSFVNLMNDVTGIKLEQLIKTYGSRFLLSSEIRSEGSIAIVKKFDFFF